MGIAGALVGGALLGLGASKMFGGRSSFDYGASSASIPYQQAAAAAPAMPAAPVAPGDAATANTGATAAAEEEERRKRAARAEANKTNFTGGLGLANPASVQRKTLLG